MAGLFGGVKNSKHFEIRLDSPFAVLYGEGHEADPVELSGTVILNNPDHMSVRSIKIKLEGKWRVNWGLTVANGSSHTIRDKGTVVNEEQVFFPSPGNPSGSHMTHRIAPGKHEWRFKFTLDPTLPESVEGLDGSFIVYDLTAEIDRGYMFKTLLATKHARVIRTLSRDLTDTVPLPYSNEDTWTNKLKYHIFIPSRYYIFGTSIPVEFTLLPLQKGITIGKIKMEVLERVGLETSKMGQEHAYATTLSDKVVASTETQMPPNSGGQLTEETSGFADESYHFKVSLPLKRSLNSFRQSVNTDHIKIYHNLKIYVNIHNPDGHVSQLCLRNLVHIYISPNIPIMDDQSVCPDLSQLQQLSQESETGIEAPPTYGTHLLDQLYDDIDPSGFLSGVNTPYRNLSRNQSVENFGSLMTSAALNPSDQPEQSRTRTPSPTDSASQLQSRLAALEDRRPITPRIVSSSSSGYNTPTMDESYFNQTNSIYAASNPTSARTSGIFTRRRSLLSRQSGSQSISLPSPPINDSTTTLHAPLPHPRGSNALSHAYRSPPPGHISITHPDGEFDMAALARIPSYNTAIRTPFAGSPESEELPSYEFVCSTTPAPAMTPQQPLTPPAEEGYNPSTVDNSNAAGLQPPKTAHVRGRSLGSGEDMSMPSMHTMHSGDRRGSVNSITIQRRASGFQGMTFGGGSLQTIWSGYRRGST